MSIRFPHAVALSALLAAMAIAGDTAACVDVSCTTAYALKQADWSECNNLAFLSPGNDSRVNLQLLTRDLMGPTAVQKLEHGQDSALFTIDAFNTASAPAAATTAPATDIADPVSGNLGIGEGSRCLSNLGGAQDFIAAVKGAKGLSDAERKSLIEARSKLGPDCAGSALATSSELEKSVRSGAARDFTTYLSGAGAFYDGRFAEASQKFRALQNSGQPWLKEASRYMIARVALNQAQVNAFSDVGDFQGPAKVDKSDLASAEAAFLSYLKAYPTGAYAASARGLLRRVYWLGGQSAKLSAEYVWGLSHPGDAQTNATAADLAQEADSKLLGAVDTAAITDPVVLATVDLMSMRRTGAVNEPKALSRESLMAQEARFAKAPRLFNYLLASHALYVAAKPGDALALLPDTIGPDPLNYLAFSEQVLRGLALEELKDGRARQHWLNLAPHAHQPYQHEAVELALAMNFERTGELDRIFAPGSLIVSADLREILIRNDAPAPLLRRLAQSSSSPKHEQRTALFVLLYKELSRGRYADFLTDTSLIPADLPQKVDPYDLLGAEPALGLFKWSGGSRGYDCGPLRQIAATLAKQPANASARLCLAEFVALNNLDDYVLDHAPPADELGGVNSQFGGKAYSRLEVYKAIIADPKAPADDRAYALYRAVNCYAPSGSNSCAGVDVPLAQRKQWFQTLKTAYPASRWADSLRYYW
jgi:TolA-binding protein